VLVLDGFELDPGKEERRERRGEEGGKELFLHSE
jgi:hypothetical protein